jgi:hypothetical protein
MDEERVAPLFQSAFDAVVRVLERFSPDERDAIERYQRALLDELRAEILGDPGHA